MELTQLYVCNNVWMEETIEGNLSISISSSINISGRISLEPAVVWGSISQSAANGVWRFQWQPPSKYKYPHAQIPACIPIQIHTARHADLVAFLHYWLSKVLNFTDFFCYFQQELLHVAIQTRDNKKQAKGWNLMRKAKTEQTSGENIAKATTDPRVACFHQKNCF